MPWVKLDLSRQEFTEAYVNVPEGFDPRKLTNGRFARVIADAVDKSHSDYDWDDSGWEDTVEVHSVVPVTEHEAKQFDETAIDFDSIKKIEEEWADYCGRKTPKDG